MSVIELLVHECIQTKDYILHLNARFIPNLDWNPYSTMNSSIPKTPLRGNESLHFTIMNPNKGLPFLSLRIPQSKHTLSLDSFHCLSCP